MAASGSWTDLNKCPFCNEEIPSPGKGFMVHINESEDCDADFEMWRDRISGDMKGGWSG